MMAPVSNIVTELLLLVLCIAAALADQQELRVDAVEAKGYIDTLIVRREEGVLKVYDEMNGKMVSHLTITAAPKEEGVYVCTDHEGQATRIDLQRAIPALDLKDLRAKDRLRLKAANGVGLAIDRSKEVIFVTADNQKWTYVAH